jgi:ubiquitin thioesterase protein OTUB1
VALRDTARLEEEIARLTSLNNLITTVGGVEEWLFEDMVAETLSLLRDVADTMQSSPEAAEQLLLQRFNDPEVSNAIVYHLRMLSSSWLKGNAAIYQDFIQGDLGVEGYCKEWLDAPNQEIDHLGIMLLIDVLLKPVGFAVEIIYLDRSAGSQVNSHMFQDEQDGVPTNPGSPIIHLLYRPSHYDILYQDRTASLPLQPQVDGIVGNADLQVNRATNFTQHQIVQSSTPTLHDFSNIDMNTLLGIPGFGTPPPPSHPGFPAQYTTLEQTYAGSQLSASISPASPTQSPGEISNLPGSTAFPPQPTSNLISPTLPPQHSPQNPFPPSNTQIPIHNHAPRLHPISPSLPSHPGLPPHQPDPSSPSSASSFRPSKYEWEAAADWQEGPVVFQTLTFKNSHYNTAHYNNPNFQPEEWSPESEEAESGRGRKRSA